MTSWQNDQLTEVDSLKWQVNKMNNWQNATEQTENLAWNDILTKWHADKTTHWQNDEQKKWQSTNIKLGLKWQDDKMTSYQNDTEQTENWV